MESILLESIRLTHVRIPLSEPLTAGNGAVNEKDAVLVEIKAGGVTGLGEGIEKAIEKTYRAVEKICWEGVHFRKDIGFKALRYNP